VSPSIEEKGDYEATPSHSPLKMATTALIFSK